MCNKAEELRHDCDELRRLIEQCARARVRDMLSLDLRKLETELSSIVVEQIPSQPVRNAVPAPSAPPKCYDVKLNNYAWDQSDKYVKIFVTLKDVQTLAAENIHCTFSPRSMELVVRELGGRNYILPITNLLNEITPEKSLWKVKTDSVIVMLAKARPFEDWSHVTFTEKKAADARAPKKPDFQGNDPSTGLMDMMKQMYDSGDDEMKRTIAKAWSESRDKQKMDDFNF